jgi:hypothetical protein
MMFPFFGGSGCEGAALQRSCPRGANDRGPLRDRRAGHFFRMGQVADYIQI